MKRSEGFFKGADGIELFYQRWTSDDVHGRAIITHGLAEHSECYDRAARKLLEAGWEVFAWDMRGHGRSDGKRGLVHHFDEYIEDYKVFIKTICQSELPFVLIGHSMGGLVTLKTLLSDRKIGASAVALSSPALGIALPVPVIKDKASRLLSKFLPTLTLSNEISYDQLTHDREIIENYPKDPLRHDKISPRLYLGMLDSFQEVFDQAEMIETPLLLQQAGIDHIVSRPEAERLFELIRSDEKKLIIYEKSFHEIYNDIESSAVFEDLVQFLKKYQGEKN